jgi:hypothetical protein
MHFRNGQEQGIGSMRNLFGLATIFMTLFLVACDGDPAFTGGTQPPTNLPGGTIPVFMGSGVGANFQDGILALSLTTLSAGGNTSVTATIVDGNNNLVIDEVSVNFSSPCAAIARASFDINPVITTTGAATATYSATGCDGDDIITASALVDGQSLSAMATVTVAPASVGSIRFESADPTSLALAGTGGAGRQETSTVRFIVTDSTGGPVSGAAVTFALSPVGSGIGMEPPTATSDVQGVVQTVVSSGTVATSVRVTATVDSLGISTQSDQLTITTGIPDNDSVSLSMVCVNIEGWSRDGVATEVTVRMADRYNNPVPDGTAITLSAEGGQVGASCLTETTPSNGAGVCSVTFVSSKPRPADGRISILATAIGEESFIDANSDGRFNAGDTELAIGEPFRNDNENVDAMLMPIYDLGEIFGDFNSNFLRDDAGAPHYLLFNGLLCETGCNALGVTTLFVSDQGVVVLSSGGAIITDSGAVAVAANTEDVATFTVTVGDVNGNPMAGGTAVSVETSNGSMVGKDSYTFLCDSSNVPTVFNFAVKGDGTTSSGLITVEVTSPSGVVTVRTIDFDD